MRKTIIIGIVLIFILGALAQSTGEYIFKNVPSAGVGATYLCKDPDTNQLQSGATCAASAYRYKTNITTYQYGVRDVMKLKPVNGNWIHNGQAFTSFIAEDVYKVNPRCVIWQDGKIFSVDDRCIIAMDTRAIQEQQRQIDKLEARIKDLELRLNKTG